MPAKKSFGPKQKQEALWMVSRGASYAEVGLHFGVAKDTIYRLNKARSFKGPSVVSGGRNLKVRLSQNHEDCLKAFREQGGFKTDSDAIRALLMSTQGFISVSDHAQADFQKLTRQIEGMATNINQVARAANTKRIDLVREQWEDVEEVRRGLRELTRFVHDVMSEMRQEGVKLWKKSEHADRMKLTGIKDLF